MLLQEQLAKYRAGQDRPDDARQTQQIAQSSHRRKIGDPEKVWLDDIKETTESQETNRNGNDKVGVVHQEVLKRETEKVNDNK